MLAVRVANKPEQDEPNPSVRIKRRPLSQTTGQKRPRTDHDVHHTCITKKSKGLYQQQCVYHPQHSILLRLSVAHINRRRRGCGRHPFTLVSLQAPMKMRPCLRTTFASDFPKQFLQTAYRQLTKTIGGYVILGIFRQIHFNEITRPI